MLQQRLFGSKEYDRFAPWDPAKGEARLHELVATIKKFTSLDPKPMVPIGCAIIEAGGLAMSLRLNEHWLRDQLRDYLSDEEQRKASWEAYEPYTRWWDQKHKKYRRDQESWVNLKIWAVVIALLAFCFYFGR